MAMHGNAWERGMQARPTIVLVLYTGKSVGFKLQVAIACYLNSCFSRMKGENNASTPGRNCSSILGRGNQKLFGIRTLRARPLTVGVLVVTAVLFLGMQVLNTIIRSTLAQLCTMGNESSIIVPVLFGAERACSLPLTTGGWKETDVSNSSTMTQRA